MQSKKTDGQDSCFAHAISCPSLVVAIRIVSVRGAWTENHVHGRSTIAPIVSALHGTASGQKTCMRSDCECSVHIY